MPNEESQIATSALVYANVHLGADCVVGPFVIVGEPARGDAPGQRETWIGDRARLRSHTVIYSGNRVGSRFETGHGVLIRESNEIGDVFVPEMTVLEDECWLGPNVVLTNVRYPTSPRAKVELQGPFIESRARIGANATLLPGVRIGREALVGAGAVVTRDVEAGTVVVGNPARVVNRVDRLPYR